jgi:hypothetical protein
MLPDVALHVRDAAQGSSFKLPIQKLLEGGAAGSAAGCIGPSCVCRCEWQASLHDRQLAVALHVCKCKHTLIQAPAAVAVPHHASLLSAAEEEVLFTEAAAIETLL